MNFDFGILDFIQSNMRNDFFDAVMPFITRLGDAGMIWIIGTLILLAIPKTRKAGIAAAVSLLLEVICCNLLLKPLIGRVRPFAFRPDLLLLVPPPGDASFPSGHTAAAFAVVFALRASGSPLWRPGLVLAAVTAFSRLYLYVHWPTDILGGILLGAAVGWAGAQGAKAISRNSCT